MSRLRSAFIVFVVAVSICSGVGAQEVAQLPVEPGGTWAAVFADNSCDLSRNFGSGDAAVKVTLSQGLAPLEVDVAVVGAGAPIVRNANRATLSSSTGLAETTSFSQAPSPSADEPIASGSFATLSTFLAEGSDGMLTFYRNRRLLASFRLTDLSDGLAMLRNCQDEMYSLFAIDRVAVRRIAVDAQPLGDQARWVTTDDVPPTFRNRPGIYRVSMRVMINAEGRVSACAIMQSSGHRSLDVHSCLVYAARARFSPAADIDQNAVPTVRMQRLHWEVPTPP